MAKSTEIQQRRLRAYVVAKALVASEKDALKAELLKGAAVEPGKITAKLVPTTQTEISWRDKFEKYHGKAMAERILARAPHKPSNSLRVQASK